MASLYQRGETWVIDQVVAGRTRTIRLGKAPKRSAEKAKRHIESIAAALKIGDSPTPEDRQWIASIDDSLRQKLVNVGLCEPSTAPAGLRTLADIHDRLPQLVKPGSSERTLEMYEETAALLLKVFGPKPIGQLTPADAITFDDYLHGRGNRPGTIQKHRRSVKALLNMVVRTGVIEANPFKNLRGGSVPASPDLQQYIPVEEALHVMEHANAGTRLLIALARFGAQRIPSEAFELRWSDVRQDEGVLIVPDKKRKLRRQVPITGVLRDELARVANGSAPDPDASIVTRSRFNLHKDLNRALERAGVERWKRPFQNLRASCETDIRQHAPSHIASMIVGHSRKVGDDHYDLGRGRWMSGLTTGLDGAWTAASASASQTPNRGRSDADGGDSAAHCENRCTDRKPRRVSRGRGDDKGRTTKPPVDPVVAGSSPVRLASEPRFSASQPGSRLFVAPAVERASAYNPKRPRSPSGAARPGRSLRRRA